MNKDTFLLNIKFGTVKIESRLIDINGVITEQSREIERDRNGVIETITEWKSGASTIKFL